MVTLFPILEIPMTTNDGLPDSYEDQYTFLDPLNASDADLDEDGDTFTNKEEYDAGSDPETIASNPGTLAFALASSTAEEGSLLTLNVNRNGGTVGAVSAYCSSMDRNALAGTDYTATVNELLQWGDGISGSQNCSVDITR